MTDPVVVVPAADPALVLVVDDAPSTRYIVCSWLRRHGHRTVEAGTGTEALAAVHEHAIDIVVLDVGLPDMTGFEVCERIKAELGLPVIHLSATSVAGRDRAQGLDRGADAYLTDPVEPGELVATVNSVLRYYRARARAEQLAEQLAALSRATMAMHSATDIDALVSAVAVGAAEMAQRPASAVVATPGLHLRRASAAGDGRAPVLSSAAPDLMARIEEHFGADADGSPLRSLPASLVGGADEVRAVLSRSRAGHPPVCITVEGSGELPAGLADVLVQLGNAAALAVDAQRLYAEEHNLALTLQRSFLPDRFPDLPGLDLAVRYLPAVRGAQVGGDFYEVVELTGGRVLVAIGDVAGHSIHAATIMIELRHALRAYAIDGHGPTAVLERLEGVLRHYYRHEYATLCLLLLDPGQDRLEIARAGHPMPLLVTADGTAAFAAADGPMLGVGLAHPPASVTALAPVRTIVLFTDGLIEDRPPDIDEAMERLRTWPDLDRDPEALCDDLIAHFGRDKSDDIALLVLRRTD
jgi:serine phosphatase RsbU (regulator of sigma subunit)/CheY-like chemotaxis protein